MRIQTQPAAGIPPILGDEVPATVGDEWTTVILGDMYRPLAEGGVFRYLPDDADGPVLLTVTVDAEVTPEGAEVCTRLVVEPGAYPITRRLLGQVDPRWLAHLLLHRGARKGGSTIEELAADFRTRPIRHKVTPARLAEVAVAYHHGGPRSVMRECSVSQSQAYRLIAAARAAGVLVEEVSS